MSKKFLMGSSHEWIKIHYFDWNAVSTVKRKWDVFGVCYTMLLSWISNIDANGIFFSSRKGYEVQVLVYP